MPVKIGGRWRAVGKVMMGNMTGRRRRVSGWVFSALETEAALSSGTGVSVCFLCRKNWSSKYYSVEFESGPVWDLWWTKWRWVQVYLRVLWFTTVIIIRVHINVPYTPSKINLIKRAGNA
jgi:hypothetical protein